jgi:hypothetical protein
MSEREIPENIAPFTPAEAIEYLIDSIQDPKEKASLIGHLQDYLREYDNETIPVELASPEEIDTMFEKAIEIQTKSRTDGRGRPPVRFAVLREEIQSAGYRDIHLDRLAERFQIYLRKRGNRSDPRKYASSTMHVFGRVITQFQSDIELVASTIKDSPGGKSTIYNFKRNS